jgi:UDP-N-acetylglucosamine transferase subunit ALG13
MIFVTVGTDSPFDRLVKVVDAWAGETGRDDVFAQIGEGAWEPKSIPFTHLLEPREFKERFSAARIIIGHAGMGTIISALLHEKPILVMPKRASLGEQRNEHQLATARRMMEIGGVNVAFDEQELYNRLDRLAELALPRQIGSTASSSLLKGLSDFIHRSTTRSP